MEQARLVVGVVEAELCLPWAEAFVVVVVVSDFPASEVAAPLGKPS